MFLLTNTIYKDNQNVYGLDGITATEGQTVTFVSIVDSKPYSITFNNQANSIYKPGSTPPSTTGYPFYIPNNQNLTIQNQGSITFVYLTQPSVGGAWVPIAYTGGSLG